MTSFLVIILISQQWSAPVDLGIPGVDDLYPQSCHKQQMYSDTMCMVWQAYQGNDWEIYSRFSMGSTWSDTIRITDNSPDDTRPRIAYDANNNRFWCVWVRNDNIFAAYSTGTTWSSSEQITSGAPIDDYPSIHCISGEMWVVWQRTSGDSVNIYSSYRSGSSWSSPIAVTQDVYVDNATPRVAESQSRVLAVWERDNDLYYSTYMTGSWQSPQAIVTSAANDSVPEIACSDFGGTAVIWQTDTHGDWEIYRTETDNFGIHYRVTNDVAADVMPCPLFYDIPLRQWDIPVIVFTSDRSGNTDIYCWDEYQGSIAIDTDPAQDLNPVLTANLRVYVWALWQTDRDGDWDIIGSYQYIPGSVEENPAVKPVDDYQYNIATIASGALSLPDGKNCTILDISGREIHTLDPAPGIYFIISNGRLIDKIIKIK